MSISVGMRPIFFTLISVHLYTGLIFGQSVEYPLHPGDQWEFYDLSGPDTQWSFNKIVKDSTLPNGKTYAFMRGSAWAMPFQRQQGDSVYQYLTDLQKEVLYFDFSRSPGDTISIFPRYSDTSVIVFLGQTSGLVFGHDLRKWMFLLDNIKSAVDDEVYYTVIDSIGVGGISCFCADLPQLSGTVINGIRYGVITGVNESNQQPGEFQLHQNFPNPFNPSTTISFTLPKTSHVTIKVYNLLGNLVKTLLDGIRAPGVYQTAFDASGLPTGIYFYRMNAGDPPLHSGQGFTQTRTMVILK